MEELVKALKLRLQSTGKSLQKDMDGKDVYLDADIFSDEQFETALRTAISMLNQFGVTVYIEESDEKSLTKYRDLIVQGATIQLLAGQALLERGREFSWSDSGILFDPPSVSEILNTQWQFEYQMYIEKIRLMKS